MTTVYALAVGLVLRRGQRTFEFERRLDASTVLFIDCHDKRPHQWKVSDLYKKIQSGDLAVVMGETNPSPNAALDGIQTIFDIDSLPDKHKKDIYRKLQYVTALRRMGLTRGMRERIDSAIAKIATQLQDNDPPSSSNLMSVWRKLDKNDNNAAALVSGHVNKRAATRKDRQLAIVRKAIRTDYCNRNRITLVQLHEIIRPQLEAEARRCGMPIEEAQISYTTLRREIKKIDRYALNASRYGRAYANNEWRYSLRGVNATRALQRYEIDHTMLDIVVVSDTTGMPLGRPTITAVVDAYSSYVAGFFISFWGPGLATTFSALKVAFAPKDDFQLTSLNIASPWLGMGVCEMLVMDNGMEFHSQQLRSLAQRLHMDLLFNRVRQPWLKPVVEQTFGKLGHHLPSTGRVEKPRDNYLPVSADQTAAITFSALCQGITMAFIDVHANSINDRTLARPIDLFGESLEKLPPPMLMGPAQDLDIVMGEQATKVIGNEGVIQDYIRYNTPELQQIRRQIGLKFKTEIRYHPDNLDRIYVRVPDTPNWLLVPSCHPDYTHNLSVVQHKAIRRFARDELSRRNADEVLMRAKESLREHWNSSVRFGKRLKAQHLKALGNLTSEHVLSDALISKPSTALLGPSDVPVCKPDLLPPLNELPTFEAISFRAGN